jgi:hypothetical protein
MAIHTSKESMLKESLTELVRVVQYCINFRKDPAIWGSHGCYGYPAAILLFSIADSIGSWIVGGKPQKHFDILKHENYYNLNLSGEDIKLIYDGYRCLLTHNALLKFDVFLDIGREEDAVFEFKNNKPYLNLLPFLKVTERAVKNFLQNLN